MAKGGKTGEKTPHNTKKHYSWSLAEFRYQKTYMVILTHRFL